MEKNKGRYLIEFVVLALLGLCNVPGADAAEKILLGVDWQILGQHAPFFAAVEKGFYKDAGLDVEIVRGYGSADAVKRVAAKTVSFSLGDMGALVIGRTEGIQVKMVAVVYGKAPYTVLTRRDAGIQTPKDLEGKNLGAPAGSATRALFPAFAKLANVDSDKVKWTTGDSTTLWNLFFARRVDGLPTFIVNKPDLDKSAREAGFEIVSMMYSDYGLVAYSNGILAREEMIKANPSQVRNFVKASIKGLEFAFKNPDECTKILLRYRKELEFEASKLQLLEVEKLAMTEEAKTNGLGYMAKEKVEKTRDLITDTYKLKVNVSADDLYTNEFLR